MAELSDVEKEIVSYLETVEKQATPAEKLVNDVAARNRCFTDTEIVSGIWSLYERKRVQVDHDSVVRLGF
jgi:hypothetical protein